jgi:hypothetical protein
VTDTPTEREAESIWTRLRRRTVVRWGIVHIVRAWGLLQGIGFVADAFRWPDATKQVATLVLMIVQLGKVTRLGKQPIRWSINPQYNPKDERRLLCFALS